MKIKAFIPKADFSKQTTITTSDCGTRIEVNHADGYQFTCTPEQLRQLIADLTQAADFGERILGQYNHLKHKRLTKCTTKTR